MTDFIHVTVRDKLITGLSTDPIPLQN